MSRYTLSAYQRATTLAEVVRLSTALTQAIEDLDFIEANRLSDDLSVQLHRLTPRRTSRSLAKLKRDGRHNVSE